MQRLYVVNWIYNVVVYWIYNKWKRLVKSMEAIILNLYISIRIILKRFQHLLFIDLENDYDTVTIKKTFSIYIAAIKNWSDSLETRIKVGSELSRVLTIMKGLRQGILFTVN